MKVFASFLLLSLFMMIGCQDDSSILEPNNNETAGILEKGRPILSDGLDFDFYYDKNTNTFSVVSKNFTVDGRKGGDLLVSESYLKDGKIISMTAKLTIPQNAFKGKLTFDMIFDFETYSVALSPTPFTFDKPLLLDITFTGVDFTNLDVDNLTFDYLDGEASVLSYSEISINKDWGILSIKGAQIPHFSRYGWTRKK